MILSHFILMPNEFAESFYNTLHFLGRDSEYLTSLIKSIVTQKKYPVCLVLPVSFLNDNTNNLLAPWKFGSIKLPRYHFCCVLILNFDWYLFQLMVCLNPGFNCCSIFKFFLNWQGYYWNVQFCISYCKCPCISWICKNAICSPG